jgi:cystathionine beta-lyase
MIYDFDHLIDRRVTESEKWRKYDEDVIPMWVADMDFISPEPVIRALRNRVEHGIFGYPQNVMNDPQGGPGLHQTLVNRMAERYNWQIQPEDLVFIPGVVRGFNVACHALAMPESRVLIQTPVYPPILKAPENADLIRQEMLLTPLPNGIYSIDWQAFEAAITDQTRLFILCNPHNPVGRVFGREELECMAGICLRHGVVICSDEIHCDLIYSGNRHIPIASLSPETAQNTITLMAPSKTFNIAGLECAIAIIQNPDLRRKFQHSYKGLVGGINLMGWVAALAAYRDGQDWLDQVLVYLEANRDFMFDFVMKELPGLRIPRPEGTYLAWLDCRQAGVEGNPYEFFLHNARVALSDGASFGRGGEGFVRLNFGCPRAMLAEALDRMKKALLKG